MKIIFVMGVNVVYLSVFGIKTIEDIHKKLYSLLHPKKEKLLEILKTLTPATNLIPEYGAYINEALS